MNAFHRPRPSSAPAFTLIELLVVIAIIAALAGMIFPAFQAAKKSGLINKAKAEIQRTATAIDSYKAKYNHYPPDHAGNPRVNQLFYELHGTAQDAAGTSFKTLDGSEQITAAQVSAIFGVGGFVNCTKASGADDFGAGQRFLSGLKPGQYGFATNNNVRYVLLTTSVNWPKQHGPVILDAPADLNPIRYNSSSPTNNPKSYDLWVDIVVGGRTNRVSNWTEQPAIVSY